MYNYKSWMRAGLDIEYGVGDFFEGIIQFIYASILNPGDIVVDGGANIGRHTIPLSRIVGETGIVYSIEAIPSLAKNLQETCNPNVMVNSVAIGFPREYETYVDFHYVEQLNGHSGIKERIGIPEYAKKSAIKIKVPIVTLDNLVCHNHKVRFVKLDLEGGEYDALRGSSRIMNEDHPFIIFENGRDFSTQVYQYSAHDWFQLFSDNKYEIFDLFGRPFGSDCWSNPDLPWYCIAVRRQDDIAFTKFRLPNLIDIFFQSLKINVGL